MHRYINPELLEQLRKSLQLTGGKPLSFSDIPVARRALHG